MLINFYYRISGFCMSCCNNHVPIGINMQGRKFIQWNLYKLVTTGPEIFGCIIEVASISVLEVWLERDLFLKGSIPSCRNCVWVWSRANKHELGPQCCAEQIQGFPWSWPWVTTIICTRVHIHATWSPGRIPHYASGCIMQVVRPKMLDPHGVAAIGRWP